MPDYRRNHYVPEWFQERFLLPGRRESKFYYLDLRPEIRESSGHRYTRNALLRWGPPRCFCVDDLYTTRFGSWESTDIEQFFFGRIDDEGKDAVEYFATFAHPSAREKAFHAMLPYMSTQKLRTPKGLANLAAKIGSSDKNTTLFQMQRLQQMYCAMWTESVWSIAEASESRTKFILSDHPITVYNEGCFPGSKYCQGHNDPEVWWTGTQTIFPLSYDRVLILTNLSWARDPYGDPLKHRPNPALFRGSTFFNFLHIQTGRKLSELEVNEINFIIKQRAFRYVAAAERDWLFPENNIPAGRWDQLGDGYLLMPDPRSMTFGGEVVVGFQGGGGAAWDEYGRRPWESDYQDKARHEREWRTFSAFQGEFARVFGPKRRGVTFEFNKLEADEDDADYHKYQLSLERNKPKNARKRKRRTMT